MSCLKFKPLAKNFLFLPFRRHIMASRVLNEAVLEKLKTNPYYEKYSQKIDELKKTTEKLTIIGVETEKASNIFKPHDVKETNVFKAKRSNPVSNKPIFKRKGLDDIMKVDQIKEKSSDEIKEIWETYHRSKDSVLSATIPASTYSLIRDRSLKYKMFLVALPREGGYEFFVLQFHNSEVHFTSLLSYQTYKENAPECLMLIYYTELMNDKGIVLMYGEYDKNIVNVIEAQCLVNQLQLYYGENNEKRTAILERFTNFSEEFNYVDLIAEIESISL